MIMIHISAMRRIDTAMMPDEEDNETETPKAVPYGSPVPQPDKPLIPNCPRLNVKVYVAQQHPYDVPMLLAVESGQCGLAETLDVWVYKFKPKVELEADAEWVSKVLPRHIVSAFIQRAIQI